MTIDSAPAGRDALDEAFARFGAGDLKGAEALCRRVLSHAPADPEANYLLGVMLLNAGKAREASKPLAQASRAEPDRPDIHVALGTALFLRQRPEEAAFHLRRAVEMEPEDAQAWNNLGTVLLALDRSAEAEDCCRTSLRIQPNAYEPLMNLGKALSAQGRCEEALTYFHEAALLRPEEADAHFCLGAAAHMLGRLEDAKAQYDRALELNPDFAPARESLTVLQEAIGAAASSANCYAQGMAACARLNLEQAERLLSRSLAIRPDFPEALCALGSLFMKLGRASAARALFERWLLLSPDSAEAWNSLASSIEFEGDLAQALACYARALEIDANLASAHNNLARVCIQHERFDEAMKHSARAVALAPEDPSALANQGVIHFRQGRLDEAERCYAAALRANPNFDAALCNLGQLRYRQTDVVGAGRAFRRALRINPRNSSALNNLALVCHEAGRPARAEELLRKAIELKPSDPEPHFNLACVLLGRERYEEGWREYEWRMKTLERKNRVPRLPRWIGEPMPDGALLVFSEQGLGDLIQFARYLPEIKRRFQGTVRFCCRPELVRLMAASDLGCEVVRHADGEPYPEGGDACIGLLCMPGMLQATPEGSPVSYLKANPELGEAWRRRLAAPERLKVGIVWAGNPDFPGDRTRSCAVQALEPLFCLPGVQYYSLQKGAPAEQLRDFAPAAGVIDLGPELGDMADTAAALANLDLLISTDTSVPHLSGALGAPAWVALQVTPDWRWLAGRSDSPWYPTVRLFRQPRPGDWSAVWARIAEELGKLAAH